jgi:ferrous iron transport protein A
VETVETTVQTILPLSLLMTGQVGEVFTVTGSGDHSKRLGELGFRQGARVEMLRPGSPCIVRLDNSRLCFRDVDTSTILVRTGSGS